MNVFRSNLFLRRRAERLATFVTLFEQGKGTVAVVALGATMVIVVPAQTLTTYSFEGGAGEVSEGPLIQATNGNLYGTAGNMLYEITPNGTITTVTTAEGLAYGALLQAANGNFYGTTVPDSGSIYRVTPKGIVTTLYSFCSKPSCADGSVPYGALVQARNGDFYGTTSENGVNGYGTVFRITPTGTLVTLWNFCAQGLSVCPDGATPRGGLVQLPNGDFYGTTYRGGANGAGTVFKITPSGVLTTLHSFTESDGQSPTALIHAANGDFYGTTVAGGSYGCGVVFKMTPSGTLSVLNSFDGPDGCQPNGIVQAANGNFYGTTVSGGTGMSGIDVSSGTIFKITPIGALTTIYNFCSVMSCADGEVPEAGLVQDTNGDFYGTTSYGGVNGIGTIFKFSIGLSPFVETQTTFGVPGAAVKILGTNLTGATAVSFNGVAAAFDVVSSSEISTKVPTDATTGKVEVVTPSGTLSTHASYTVLP